MAQAPPAISPRRNHHQSCRAVSLARTCLHAAVLTAHLARDRDAAPSDLQYLTDENTAEIGTKHEATSADALAC